MPPSSTPPSLSTTPSLLVKWRAQTFTLPAPASLTLADLKSRLFTLTAVSPERQTLLFPSLNKPKDDSQPLLSLFLEGKLPTRPIKMLGTPTAPPLEHPPASEHLPDVVDDLDELLTTPVVPPRPPRARLPPYSPLRSTAFERLHPRLQRRLLSGFQPREPDESDESDESGESGEPGEAGVPQASQPSPSQPSPSFQPPRENPSATNGATLSLETLDEALRGAQTGMAFISKRMTRQWLSPWQGADADGFMDAVSKSRQRLRMLAVVMFDFNSKPEESGKLLRAMVRQAPVRGVLDRSFHTLPVDLGTLEDGGVALLGRLGLHAAPVVIVLGDVGASVSIVDMFNTEWFGNVQSHEGVSALGMRFEETLANFDTFYGTAKARRDVSDGRERMIQEQDDALQAAIAADREREERESAAAEERRRREEEEQSERRRQQEEQEREQARREAESAEAKRLLPGEPEAGGARIVLRLPDGRRVERSFEETACVGDLFNLAVSEGVQKGTFELKSTFPRRVFTEEQDGRESLRNAGFVPSVTLNVEQT